ncbi:MAG: hypothetical protein R2778_09810 [Saprospiraceae bacterium]
MKSQREARFWKRCLTSKIAIVGGMYDIETGEVNFYEHTPGAF